MNSKYPKVNIGLLKKLIPIFLIAICTTSHLNAQKDGDSHAVKKQKQNLDAEYEESLKWATKHPGFIGGRNAYSDYVKDNMIYPKSVLEGEVSGKVHVKFVVKKDGSAERFEVFQGLGGECAEEAIRLLKSVPKWRPGEKDGVIGDFWSLITVNFVLSGNVDLTLDRDDEYLSPPPPPPPAPPREEEVYMNVEVPPQYKDGYDDFEKFVKENIQYPKIALEQKIQGKVYVKFVVNKEGGLENHQVLKGIGGGCDEEAIRVLKNMPKWKPGTQLGKPLNVWYTVPVKFVLPDHE